MTSSAAPPPRGHAAITSQTIPPAASSSVSSADASFRAFFTKLSAADIQRGAAEAASAAAAHAANAAAAAAPLPVGPASEQAIQCYRELHSSMPLLHVHHLDALRSWLSACFAARVLPRAMDAEGATVFRMTPELLEAVRSQARLPPVHSRLGGAGADATAARVKPTAAAAADDDEETPSFAEALAADAGKATAALSRRRGAATNSSADSTAAASSSTSTADLSATAAAVPVDGRMSAAAALYAVLLVHSLPVIIGNAASTTAPSAPISAAASCTPLDFLRGIPLSLAAAARAAEEERARAHATAAQFVWADDESDPNAPPLDPDEEMLAYESDADDFIFTADPVPDSSDDDNTDDASEPHPLDRAVLAPTSASKASQWGSLDSIPVEAHAIEAQVLSSASGGSATNPAAASASSSAVAVVDWPSLRAKVCELISLWDTELFTLGSVWEELELEQPMLSLWRTLSTSRGPARKAWDPLLDRGMALGHVRHAILLQWRAVMLARLQHGGATLVKLLHPLVQEVLSLPHLVPGAGVEALPTSGSNDDDDDEGEQRSPYFDHWDPEGTLVALLAQLCSAASPHTFPAQLAAVSHTHSSSPSSAASSIAHLHSFVSFLLPWLSRRLSSWRRRWTSMLAAHQQGSSVRFLPRIRERMEQLRAMEHIVAFYAGNHPARRGAAAAAATTNTAAAAAAGSINDNEDAGAKLINTGLLSHIVALVLSSQHTLCHSHHAVEEGAVAAHYCSACRSFEQARAYSDVQLHASVTSDGTYSCTIHPYVSSFDAVAVSPLSSLPAGSVAVPSSSTPNPLHSVHELLLLLATSSPLVCRFLMAHPTFMECVRCACYEEQYVLPAMLLPVIISVHTRALDVATATASPVGQSQAATATAATASSTGTTKKKEKKSKLIVAALPTDEEEAGGAAAADDASGKLASVELDALSWQTHSATPQILLAALRRSLFVLQQAIAQLPAAPEVATGAVVVAGSAAAVDASPVVVSPTTLSTPLRLLAHVVQHFHQFAATSTQHRLLLSQLASAASSSLSAYHDERVAERAVVSALVVALRDLRQQLPHVSKVLQTQLQHAGKSSAAAALTAYDDSASGNADPEHRSILLSQLAAEHDSRAGHTQRQNKQALEQCHGAVLRLQQWLKVMFMEGAKKD